MRLPSAESWFIFETMLARKSNRPWQEELDATLCDNLPATDAIYQRFAGIGGSAYFVGGLGMTALTMNDIVVVPIRTGVGIRLGANVGYLKFTPTATWNPF